MKFETHARFLGRTEKTVDEDEGWGAVRADHVLALSQFSQKIDCGIFSILFIQPHCARVWIGYTMTDEVAKQMLSPSRIPSH